MSKHTVSQLLDILGQTSQPLKSGIIKEVREALKEQMDKRAEVTQQLAITAIQSMANCRKLQEAEREIEQYKRLMTAVGYPVKEVE